VFSRVVVCFVCARECLCVENGNARAGARAESFFVAVLLSLRRDDLTTNKG